MALFGLLGSKQKQSEVLGGPGKQGSQENQGNQESEEKAIQKFSSGLISIKDIIAPSAIEVDFNQLLVGSKFFRTYFVTGYPRFVGANWLSPLINFDNPIDISTYYYPVDTGQVMERLKRKIGEFEATINLALDEGKIPDPSVKVALSDARELQEQLASGTEKYFHFALYLTIRANSLKELERISRKIESTLASIGVVIKIATLQQEEAFRTTMPISHDEIYITRNMDTTSLATTFPFVSSELTMEEGILYGLNKHNNSLVIFDRFRLANANMVVFATSGAGKSYFVKLEAMRSLMFGTEILVIDPEKEYEKLCKTIGGEYISFSQDGDQKLNPFELSGIYQKDEDELRFKILSLNGLIKIMLGGTVTPEESAILDRSIILTYKEKGITPDPSTHRRPAPLLSDLYKILQAMAEPQAHSMAGRLERYVKGSAAGIFDQPTNIELRNTFTVFSIRDLSEDLRPIAMFMMLDYIWTRIKRDRRKRLLVIDEAWWLMQHPDAAKFVHSIAKRARKYALGLTTITQDVEDFLDTDYGKAVVTNSAIQMLLKQSPAAIDRIQKVFYLTQGEKNYLLSAGIGEGLFFAGSNHVAVQVIASENEHNLITTNPIEIMQREEKEEQIKQQQAAKLAPKAG
ncbi:MAG: Type IV secretory pathway VirB4 component-like protein [candidate division WS6 bacterium GW2011_GWA2_37_6]|uniref:Type IV secretory pathway VirB4 component-like protein n=1 Tax=candidate division WS6 bacterium GW2011_GWA2_37_6 TaxID=1619087 RepID=A0A0G0JHK4_9BACT|nr:MAG: Type IV secretory pathway VirB4 component-like protein [candidate division WS6 bacterium GW2011_GWA2_37_6]